MVWNKGRGAKDVKAVSHRSLRSQLSLVEHLTLCREGNDHTKRRKEHLWNTQLVREHGQCPPQWLAGTAQSWIATEHIAYMQQRHQAGHCLALSRTLPKFYHRTTASKPAWPFWVLNFRWLGRLRNASHFWLCFLISLYFLFFLHSFPMSPFAVLGRSYSGWRVLKSPWCCYSCLLEERGKSQERIISEATRNIASPHAAMKHSWERETCLLPTICPS